MCIRDSPSPPLLSCPPPSTPFLSSRVPWHACDGLQHLTRVGGSRDQTDDLIIAKINQLKHHKAADTQVRSNTTRRRLVQTVRQTQLIPPRTACIACCALSGTDPGLWCYALCGTGVTYGAMRCVVLTSRMLLRNYVLSNALNKQERSELASGQHATSCAVHPYSYAHSMLRPTLYTHTIRQLAYLLYNQRLLSNLLSDLRYLIPPTPSSPLSSTLPPILPPPLRRALSLTRLLVLTEGSGRSQGKMNPPKPQQAQAQPAQAAPPPQQQQQQQQVPPQLRDPPTPSLRDLRGVDAVATACAVLTQRMVLQAAWGAPQGVQRQNQVRSWPEIKELKPLSSAVCTGNGA
eukprot:3713317-Rhodomonas_salina.2